MLSLHPYNTLQIPNRVHSPHGAGCAAKQRDSHPLWLGAAIPLTPAPPMCICGNEIALRLQGSCPIRCKTLDSGRRAPFLPITDVLSSRTATCKGPSARAVLPATRQFGRDRASVACQIALLLGNNAVDPGFRGYSRDMQSNLPAASMQDLSWGDDPRIPCLHH